jgi:hypothetical protein
LKESGVTNDSEEFRRQCEARYVIKMDKERRKAHYIGVEKKRGRAAMLELWEEAKRQAREVK